MYTPSGNDKCISAKYKSTAMDIKFGIATPADCCAACATTPGCKIFNHYQLGASDGTTSMGPGTSDKVDPGDCYLYTGADAETSTDWAANHLDCVSPPQAADKATGYLP